MEEITFESVVQDVVTLARHMATGTPPQVRLSPEVANLLTKEAPVAVIMPPEPPVAPKPIQAHALRPQGTQETLPKTSHGPDTLEGLSAEIAVCERCPLHQTRTHTVPGEGHPQARLVFVGEAPGADEDRQGRPFVGAAGRLLTDIITKGMKLAREEVYICNILKCRPPNNRTPAPEEVYQCEPYLVRQLDLIQPEIICALGLVAAQTLLKTSSPLKSLRGEWHDYHGVPLRVTYHPAYLLRNPADKRLAWEDVQEIMKRLDPKS